MKILKNKTYEKLQQCLTELQLDLNDKIDENKLLEEQVKYLQTQLKSSNDIVTKLGYDIDDKNKEIKRLKTLLTKNKIEYKKEDNNAKSRQKNIQEK